MKKWVKILAGMVFVFGFAAFLVVILNRGIGQNQTPQISFGANQGIKVSTGSLGSYNPDLLTDSNGKKHVIWGEVGDEGQWEVKYTNGQGGTFKAPVTLSGLDYRSGQILEDPTNSQHLVIVFTAYRQKYGGGCSDGASDAGCSDGFYMETTNGGNSWTKALVVPHSTDRGHRYNITGTMTPTGDLVVVYMKNSGAQLSWNRLSKSNHQWGSEQNIPGAPAFSQFPAIESDSTGWYLAFTGGADGPASSLYFAKATSNGSWNSARVVDSGSRPYYSDIALNGSNVYLINSDQRRNQVGLLVSINGGTSFQSSSLTNNSSARYFSSQIAQDNDDNFYVLWSQGTSPNSQVVLKSGPLNSLDPMSVPNQTNMVSPSLSVGESDVSVAYQSNSEGKYSIYVFSNPINGGGNNNGGNTGLGCQGNPNAPAKCFSCFKDSPVDQVNILDFACFAKYYGKQISGT